MAAKGAGKPLSFFGITTSEILKDLRRPNADGTVSVADFRAFWRQFVAMEPGISHESPESSDRNAEYKATRFLRGLLRLAVDSLSGAQNLPLAISLPSVMRTAMLVGLFLQFDFEDAYIKSLLRKASAGPDRTAARAADVLTHHIRANARRSKYTAVGGIPAAHEGADVTTLAHSLLSALVPADLPTVVQPIVATGGRRSGEGHQRRGSLVLSRGGSAYRLSPGDEKKAPPLGGHRTLDFSMLSFGSVNGGSVDGGLADPVGLRPIVGFPCIAFQHIRTLSKDRTTRALLIEAVVTKLRTLKTALQTSPEHAARGFVCLCRVLEAAITTSAPAVSPTLLTAASFALAPMAFWPLPFGDTAVHTLDMIEGEIVTPGKALVDRTEGAIRHVLYLGHERSDAFRVLCAVAGVPPLEFAKTNSVKADYSGEDGDADQARATVAALYLLHCASPLTPDEAKRFCDKLSREQARNLVAKVHPLRHISLDPSADPVELSRDHAAALSRVKEDVLKEMEEKITARTNSWMSSSLRPSICTALQRVDFTFLSSDIWQFRHSHVVTADGSSQSASSPSDAIGVLSAIRRERKLLGPDKVFVAVVGGHKALHEAVCGCARLAAEGEPTPHVLVLPLSHTRNVLADFLARADFWYHSHVYNPLRQQTPLLPWAKASARDARLTPVAESGLAAPGSAIRSVVENYARFAHNVARIRVFGVWAWVDDEPTAATTAATAKTRSSAQGKASRDARQTKSSRFVCCDWTDTPSTFIPFVISCSIRDGAEARALGAGPSDTSTLHSQGGLSSLSAAQTASVSRRAQRRNSGAERSTPPLTISYAEAHGRPSRTGDTVYSQLELRNMSDAAANNRGAGADSTVPLRVSPADSRLVLTRSTQLMTGIFGQGAQTDQTRNRVTEVSIAMSRGAQGGFAVTCDGRTFGPFRRVFVRGAGASGRLSHLGRAPSQDRDPALYFPVACFGLEMGGLISDEDEF